MAGYREETGVVSIEDKDEHILVRLDKGVAPPSNQKGCLFKFIPIHPNTGHLYAKFTSTSSSEPWVAVAGTDSGQVFTHLFTNYKIPIQIKMGTYDPRYINSPKYRDFPANTLRDGQVIEIPLDWSSGGGGGGYTPEPSGYTLYINLYDSRSSRRKVNREASYALSAGPDYKRIDNDYGGEDNIYIEVKNRSYPVNISVYPTDRRYKAIRTSHQSSGSSSTEYLDLYLEDYENNYTPPYRPLDPPREPERPNRPPERPSPRPSINHTVVVNVMDSRTGENINHKSTVKLFSNGRLIDSKSNASSGRGSYINDESSFVFSGLSANTDYALVGSSGGRNNQSSPVRFSFSERTERSYKQIRL